MPCSDPKRREFAQVPGGATYELSVIGPPGFSVLAHFDDAGNNKIVKWPARDLRPGPKQQRLNGAGVVHAVHIFVNIDPTKDIAVKVEATVGEKSYCRTVSGRGTQEIIVHDLRMA